MLSIATPTPPFLPISCNVFDAALRLPLPKKPALEMPTFASQQAAISMPDFPLLGRDITGHMAPAGPQRAAQYLRHARAYRRHSSRILRPITLNATAERNKVAANTVDRRISRQ